MNLKSLSSDPTEAPKVSVIIPAYNAMAYLPATLSNVFQQTFSNFEVLLVDDGSTDFIKSWVSQTVSDRRLKLISQENQGPSTARNAGIACSRGEYIAFLDSDDLWHPTKLERQVKWLDDHPNIGLLYSWTTIIDSEGKSTGRVFDSEIEGDVLSELLQRNIIDGTSSVMVRRQCFEVVGLFDTTLQSMEDWEMWIRISDVYPFSVIREPLVYYRQHLGNISKNWRVMEQSFLQVIEKAFSTTPIDLQHLRPISLGHAYLVLAWKALQSQEPDYRLARQFKKQAISYNPYLFTSRENLKLSVAILALEHLGEKIYANYLNIFHALRRRLFGIAV